MSDLRDEPSKQPRPLDASIIATAPIEPGELGVSGDQDQEHYLELIGDLALQVEELTAENAKLKGKLTVDDVRARLLAPFSNKVFWFVAAYCVAVGGILIMSGFGTAIGFKISDTVLSIIAGSTAVSVIGLIGMVISGLFGSTKPPSSP